MITGWATDSAAQDPNNEISQSRAWQRNNVGATPGFRGDLKLALASIRAEVLFMPCTTDLYFTMEDIQRESRMIHKVKVAPIRSVWGHAAGAGQNEEDAATLNREIAGFLR
jgi:homoserine O-acetyltransferase